MSGARRHLDPDADPAAGATTQHAVRPDAGRAIARSADPRLAHAGGAPGLLHLQRTAGNAAVASLVAPSVQRVVEIDEMSSDVGAGPAAPVAGTPTGTPGGETAGAPAATGPTTITGTSITLDAPITTSPGVVRADTIIANSVVAENYTPGAGNIW